MHKSISPKAKAMIMLTIVGVLAIQVVTGYKLIFAPRLPLPPKPTSIEDVVSSYVGHLMTVIEHVEGEGNSTTVTARVGKDQCVFDLVKSPVDPTVEPKWLVDQSKCQPHPDLQIRNSEWIPALKSN